MSLFRRSKSKNPIKQKDKPQDHAGDTPLPPIPQQMTPSNGGVTLDDLGMQRDRSSGIKTAPLVRRKDKPENLRDRVISQP